jgi:hypothetical protein
MKQKIEKILKQHGLLASDATDIFAAMGEILEEAAKITEQTSPHATNSIRQLVEFSRMINDYESFLEMYS